MMNHPGNPVCVVRPYTWRTDVIIGRYDDHYDHWSREDDEKARGLSSPPPPVDDAPVPIDRNLSGEEAFQRRLALSMRPPVPAPASPPAAEPTIRPGDSDLPESSTTIAPYKQSRDQVPPSFSAPAPPELPPTTPEEEIAFSSLAYNPFAPPSVPPPPGPPDVSAALAFEAKVKAASAIAAKLGAIAATATGSEPTPPVVAPSDEEASTTKRSSPLLSITDSHADAFGTQAGPSWLCCENDG
jgi:splicing factor 45